MPLDDLHTHYKDLIVRATAVLNGSFSTPENLQRQAYSHVFAGHLKTWRSVITPRDGQGMVDIAIQEFEFALLSVAQGYYRQAFKSLRLCLEMCLAAVYFSTKEVERRRWEAGKRDVIWGEITNEQTGIFSKDFIEVFFQSLTTDKGRHLAIALTVYRQCSEHVHGNAIVQQGMPASISFDQRLFEQWHEAAGAAMGVIHYSFCMRYLLGLNDAGLEAMEPVLQACIWHLEPIRAVFQNSR